MTVSLTDIKQQKIKTLIGETLHSKKLKIRQIAKILGTFEAFLPAIKSGRLSMFYLQKCKNEALKLNTSNYEGLINLTENSKSELQWWQKGEDSVNDTYHPLPQLKIYSDACPNGLGAACEKHSAGGNWSKEKSSLHINVLKMEAAFFAVKIYAATLSETSIHLRVDNTATLAWINSKMQNEFWEFCAKKQIWVHASYISSSRNKVADKESRKLRDNLEWLLKEKFFEKIVVNFGPVTIDLFASRVNFKVNWYYSYNLEPEAIGIGASSYR